MFLTSKKITIAVTDDHPVILEGLQRIFPADLNMNEIQQFSSGEELLLFVTANPGAIDVILLDVTLPGKSGIEICREVKKIAPQTSVLGFSNHTERGIILQMLQNGASGYLVKNATSIEIVNCVKAVLEGNISFSKEASNVMAKPSADDLKIIPRLTKREKEILVMIAEGKTSLDIGNELFVSVVTVETHRRNLMQKFGVKNVAALIKIATENKLL